MEVVVAGDGRAEMPYFSRLRLFIQHGPQLVLIEDFVCARMKLIKIDVVRPERFERGIELSQHRLRRPFLTPVQMGMKLMPELGGNDPIFTPSPGDVAADERFGRMVPVAFRRIDQIDAARLGFVQNRVRFLLGKWLAPFAAELPCADPDDGHLQVRFAQLPVFQRLPLLE